MSRLQVGAAATGLVLLAALAVLIALDVQGEGLYWAVGAGALVCVVVAREPDNWLGRTVRGVFGGVLLAAGAFLVWRMQSQPWSWRSGLVAGFGLVWGALMLLWAVIPRRGPPDQRPGSPPVP